MVLRQVVTGALEVELMACWLCEATAGRRRIPSERTMPRGLGPNTVIALAREQGVWRVAVVIDGRS